MVNSMNRKETNMDDEAKGTRLYKSTLLLMFRMVGLKYNWEQILAYAKRYPQWYHRHSITKEECAKLEKYFKNECKRLFRYMRKRPLNEAWGYFHLMYGWKTKGG